MSKLQLFKDFVNERLAAVALEISGRYEETLAKYEEEEIRRSKEQIGQLRRHSAIDVFHPEIKTHRTDVPQFSLFETPHIKGIPPADVQQLPFPIQIKQEQDMWTSQEGEQLQWLQSDTRDSIFSPPRVETYCVPEISSQLPSLDQTPTVENKESFPTNTTEEPIKVEPDKEDYGAADPASDSQPTSVLPALSWPGLEWWGGLGPEAAIRVGARAAVGNKSKTPEKTYQCEYCDKAFSHQSSLIRHRPIHAGTEPYRCEVCNKGFGQACTLVSHRRKVHTKPYQCPECDKSFSSNSWLEAHRSVHRGEKPYQCQECNKCFCQKSDLVRHIRIHTGEKPYRCERCGKAFNQHGSLVSHRRIHTREKPYQCGECGIVFSRNSFLVAHRKIHTGGRPYQCEKCDAAFSQKLGLVRHRRCHTEEMPLLV